VLAYQLKTEVWATGYWNIASADCCLCYRFAKLREYFKKLPVPGFIVQPSEYDCMIDAWRWRGQLPCCRLVYSIAFHVQVLVNEVSLSRCNRTAPQKFVNDLLSAAYSEEYMACRSLGGTSSKESSKLALPPEDVLQFIGRCTLCYLTICKWKTNHYLYVPLTYRTAVLSYYWLGIRKRIWPVEIKWWYVAVFISV